MVEDVVDVLIKKKLIEITDFQIPAQQKLISRRGKRKDFGYLTERFPAEEEDEEELVTWGQGNPAGNLRRLYGVAISPKDAVIWPAQCFYKPRADVFPDNVTFRRDLDDTAMQTFADQGIARG